MLPRALQKQLSNQHPNLHRFWNQLGSILGGFGEPSWSQVGTKSLQKSIQKVITKKVTFWKALGRDFDRFWCQLGGLGGGRKLSLFAPLVGVLVPLGAKMPPRPLQDPPRELQGPILGGFGTPLDGFLLDFGSIFGKLLLHFWLIFELIC